MTTLAEIERELTADDKDPGIKIGDTVRVHVRITEGTRSRIQVFEGTVIALKHGGNRATFTVRKVSYNVAVERIFPFQSPSVELIEIKSRHRVRRAKLYYLRGRYGKSSRLKEIRWTPPSAEAAEDSGKKRKRRGKKRRRREAEAGK